MSRLIAAIVFFAAVLPAASAFGGASAEPAPAAGGARPTTQPAAADQAVLDMKFAAMLDDVQFVGSYTRGDAATPRRRTRTSTRSSRR